MNATLVTNSAYQQLPAMSNSYFQVEIIINKPPIIDPYSYNTYVTIYAHRNWNVTVAQLSDDMNDDPYFDCLIVNYVVGTGWVEQPSPAWFVTNNATPGAMLISFVNPPQPSIPPPNPSQLWTLRIKLWDVYNILTPNYYFINITILHNYPPENIAGTINYVIPSVQVPFGFSKTFWLSNFIDHENDKIFIDCSSRLMNTSVAATWTNCD